MNIRYRQGKQIHSQIAVPKLSLICSNSRRSVRVENWPFSPGILCLVIQTFIHGGRLSLQCSLSATAHPGLTIIASISIRKSPRQPYYVHRQVYLQLCVVEHGRRNSLAGISTTQLSLDAFPPLHATKLHLIDASIRASSFHTMAIQLSSGQPRSGLPRGLAHIIAVSLCRAFHTSSVDPPRLASVRVVDRSHPSLNPC